MRRRIEEEGATCIYLEEAEDDDNEWDCGDHRSRSQTQSQNEIIPSSRPCTFTNISHTY